MPGEMYIDGEVMMVAVSMINPGKLPLTIWGDECSPHILATWLRAVVPGAKHPGDADPRDFLDYAFDTLDSCRGWAANDERYLTSIAVLLLYAAELAEVLGN